MEKVSEDQARAEVNAWLDAKRVKPPKREAHSDAIDDLVYAMVYGQLTLDSETNEFNQKLDVPIEGEGASTTDLKYKFRLRVNETHSKMKGVKANDPDGRVMALVAALTGKPRAIIGKLDTGDYSVAQSIALFFL